MDTWASKVLKLKKVTNGSLEGNLCSHDVKKDVITWAAFKVLSAWIAMFFLRTISAFLEFPIWKG